MTDQAFWSSRHKVLLGAAGTAIAAGLPPIAVRATAASVLPPKAKALPLADVRLLPSAFLDAVEANRRYLLQLEPDRLLHNFLKFAGLDPKGELYGGWERDTIAGHTLGHYLAALALLHAQTGDAEACRRAGYIVDGPGAGEARRRLCRGLYPQTPGRRRRRRQRNLSRDHEGRDPLGGIRPQRLLGAVTIGTNSSLASWT